MVQCSRQRLGTFLAHAVVTDSELLQPLVFTESHRNACHSIIGHAATFQVEGAQA